MSSKDAVGPGRFGVSCNMRTDSHRIGHASFRVLAPNGGGTGGNGPIDNPNNPTQLPKRIETGLGDAADSTGRDGLDPVLLLPAAGQVLIALAAGLWVRQPTIRRWL